MVLRNTQELDVFTVQSVVKVDNTLAGIEEGLSPENQAIALVISANEVGVTLAKWDAFPEEVKQKHRDRIYPTMYPHGAHYVVYSIADLMPCLDGIEARMKRADKPRDNCVHIGCYREIVMAGESSRRLFVVWFDT